MEEKMHVIALMRFNDKLEGVARNEGDIFTVTAARYEQIMAYRTDLIELYEVDPPADPDDAEKADDGKGGEVPAEAGDAEKSAEGAEPPADPDDADKADDGKGEAKAEKPAAKKTQRKNASKQALPTDITREEGAAIVAAPSHC